jgi:hypothetical protein
MTYCAAALSGTRSHSAIVPIVRAYYISIGEEGKKSKTSSRFHVTWNTRLHKDTFAFLFLFSFLSDQHPPVPHPNHTHFFILDDNFEYPFTPSLLRPHIYAIKRIEKDRLDP